MNERRVQRELEKRMVTIREVNPAQRFIQVTDQFQMDFRITLRDNDPLTVIPYPGEVWVASRSGVDWYLEHQIDNPTTIIKTEELQAGDRRVEAKGTVYIEGSDIVLNGVSVADLGSDPTTVRKNSTGTVFERTRLNFIEGTNVTIAVADDAVDGEVDITISSSGGGGGSAGLGLRVNSTGSPSTVRPTLNVIGGTNVTTSYVDDPGNTELDLTIAVTSFPWGSLTGVPGTFAPSAHKTSHETGGGDALTGNLDAVARSDVRKNSAGSVFSRRRLNFIEGSNVTLTIADDAGNEEVDITIASSGAGGGGTTRAFATFMS